MDIYTYCQETDTAEISRIKRKSGWSEWEFVLEGEWAQTIYHQGNCSIYVSSTSDGDRWRAMSTGFPNRVIAVAIGTSGRSLEEVLAAMLVKVRSDGGDFLSGVDTCGNIDIEVFEKLYFGPMRS